MELKETMTLPNVKSGSLIKIKDRYYVVYKSADGPHTATRCVPIPTVDVIVGYPYVEVVKDSLLTYEQVDLLAKSIYKLNKAFGLSDVYPPSGYD